MIPKLKTIERLSWCCKAEMYQSGACTNCGADGLNKPMTKEKYEFLCSSEDEAESELCSFIVAQLEVSHDIKTQAYHLANAAGRDDDAMDHYWNAMAVQRAIRYVEDWKNSL